MGSSRLSTVGASASGSGGQPPPGPATGRVVHAPAGGCGQGGLSTAGARADPPPLRDRPPGRSSESVSLALTDSLEILREQDRVFPL